MKLTLLILAYVFCISNYVTADSACSQCKVAMKEFLNGIRSGFTDAKLKKILEFYCPVIWLYTESNCVGTIDSYYPTMKYIIDTNPYLTPELICGQVFQAFNGCEMISNPHSIDWSIELSPGGPTELVSKTNPPSAPIDEEPITILQITDFHFDPLYQIGGVVNCPEIVCCRILNDSVPLSDRAGKYGNYNYCDMPWETIESAIDHAAKTHKKIDYIYATGDFADHALWDVTWPKVFYAIKTIIDKLQKTFPNVPIIPILGNHEPNPTDSYSPPYIHNMNMSSDPLYEYMSNEFTWLPQEARQTMLQGGYYTLLLRPGFRLIILNNNVCLANNWWILFNYDIMATPLQWLQNTLYKAEQAGELVHILAHVPPGNSFCAAKYGQEFDRIVERYRNTIQAQFNGHTHRDQFNLIFSKDDPFVPVNVAWNGGSISTWTADNPNYKIYTVDPKSFHVFDYQTWIFNLTEANLTPDEQPNWFLEYSFRDAYNVSDTSPATLWDLAKRMALDENLLTKYWQYYVKQGDLSYMKGCNSECLNEQLCGIVTSVWNDGNERCPYLLNLTKTEN